MPSIVKNSFFSTLSLALKVGTHAVLSIVLARVLGANEFGRFVFATTFTGIFLLIVDYSFNLQVVRQVANSPAETPEIVQRMLSAKLLLSFACTLIILLTLLVSHSSETDTVILVLWLGVLCFSFGQFLNNVFKGVNKFELETYPMLLLNSALFLIVVLLLMLGHDLVLIASGYTVARIFYLGISYRCYRRHFGGLRFHLELGQGLKTLYELLPFGIYSILAVIYLQIDTIMLSYMQNDSQVGHYQAAMRIALATTLLSEIILSSFFPLVAKAIHSDPAEFRARTLLLNKYLLVIGAFLGATLAIFSDSIIDVLYGGGYAPSALLLRLLAVVVFLRFAGAGFGMIINISRNQRWCTIGVSISAVMNIILNCYAIPRHGAVGAAVVSIVTHLVLNSLYVIFAYRAVRSFYIGKLCLRGLVIITLCAVAALYLKQLQPLWGAALFVLLPFLLVRFCLSKEEMESILRIFRKGLPLANGA
ncbi:flippase [Geomonas nitrogeniifigens]|uniref:Flippase n=1 Tax=Geomonas diazotrophica TaxID=2843197 RepID=A0ABX8JBZ1_9BACT|nr:flippase [Geomonas nitrogeniifigens]QWV95950.1 flippase [Geomonas nitrogeniifigens]